MATTNVVAQKTGLGWTIDVTAANLSPDLTLKDFVVIKAGALEPNSNYTKTTSTVLTYVGAVSLPANTTVEVRRKTPAAPVQTVGFAQRFSSGDFNNEIDRITRRAEEYDLNGVGAGSIITVQTPLDTVYGASWNGNIVNPPTMNAVYDKVELLAPKANPTFTGSVILPTVAAADNTFKAAYTGWVQTEIANKANVASPTFTGTPSMSTTPAVGTNSLVLANTAFVIAEKDNIPTQPVANDTTKAANTSFVTHSNRPAFRGYVTSGGQVMAHGGSTAQAVVLDTIILDTHSTFNANKYWYVPAGMTGYYLATVWIHLQGGSYHTLITGVLNGTTLTFHKTGDQRASADVLHGVGGTIVLYAEAGQALIPALQQLNTGIATRQVQAGFGITYMELYRLNV